jgi:hypothetical protein
VKEIQHAVTCESRNDEPQAGFKPDAGHKQKERHDCGFNEQRTVTRSLVATIRTIQASPCLMSSPQDSLHKTHPHPGPLPSDGRGGFPVAALEYSANPSAHGAREPECDNSLSHRMGEGRGEGVRVVYPNACTVSGGNN